MAASGGKRNDVTLEQNVFNDEDRPWHIRVTDSAGDPQNLTGFTLIWELLDKLGGAVLIAKSGADITLANGAGTNDEARVSVPDTDLETAAPTTAIYFYNLRRTDTDNEGVLVYGNVLITDRAAVTV